MESLGACNNAGLVYMNQHETMKAVSMLRRHAPETSRMLASASVEFTYRGWMEWKRTWKRHLSMLLGAVNKGIPWPVPMLVECISSGKEWWRMHIKQNRTSVKHLNLIGSLYYCVLCCAWMAMVFLLIYSMLLLMPKEGHGKPPFPSKHTMRHCDTIFSVVVVVTSTTSAATCTVDHVVVIVVNSHLWLWLLVVTLCVAQRL